MTNTNELFDKLTEKMLEGIQLTASEREFYASFASKMHKKANSQKPKGQKAKTKKAKTKKAKTATANRPTADEVYLVNLAKNGFEPGEVHLTEYSKKAFAVFGDTKPIASVLASAGAKLNRFLTHGQKMQAGWIISKKLISKKDLKALVNA